MTTQQTTWTEYTGSDEQIAELFSAENGFIVNSQWSIFNDPNQTKISFDEIRNVEWLKEHFENYKVTSYWIIPDDPLREMKIRQSMTGQPVWVRREKMGFKLDETLGSVMCPEIVVEVTTTPDWNIPNAEYNFTPFEEDK